MVFRQRRDNQPGSPDAQKGARKFRHSSGAPDLAELLGLHTLDDRAEPVAPKGYRARSTAKIESSR